MLCSAVAGNANIGQLKSFALCLRTMAKVLIISSGLTDTFYHMGEFGNIEAVNNENRL